MRAVSSTAGGRHGGKIHYWSAWLGLLALVAALTGCLGATEPSSSRQVTVAELIETGAAPRAVELPDQWEHTAPERDGAVHYRIAIPDAALSGEGLNLFTLRAGMSLRLLLNGHPFASVGSFERPLPDMSQEPLLVALPSALLESSGNVLEIELHGERRRESGLSELWFGPLSELRPMHARAQRDRVHSAYAVSAAATVMGLLALLLAVRMRGLPYAYFGVASLLWAWRMALMTPPTSMPGSALGPAIETVFFYVSYPWFVSLMTLYALASIGRETPRVRRWVIGWSVLAFVLILLNWGFNLPLLRTLVSAGMLLMLAALMLQLFDAAWRERSQPAILLSVAALLAFAVGLRDFYVFRITWDYGALTWSRYTILLLLGVLAWMLVDEFTRSTLALRQLNRELVDRVAQKERELLMVFEDQRKRDRDQATRAERDRILREMHDGLGGRLVAALALTQQVQPGDATGDAAEPVAEGAELAQAPMREAWRELRSTLDDCLIELRLTLDSLEVEQRPLVEALAELRFRVEPSLRAAGVRLVWQPSETLSSTELGAGDTLQILRIVREALTNVLKHAQASVVWLRLEPVVDGDAEQALPRALQLSVVDNGLAQRTQQAGEGLAPPMPGGPGPGRGRGLINMERRAAAVGASFSSGPQAEGWCVQIELPLPSTTG